MAAMVGMGISAAKGIRNTSTATRTSACTMPAMGVRPPAFTFAAVRAIAPVAGMPPNNTDAMLPTPCATSSVLARWCALIMESATTQDSSDSMAAKMAIVAPFASWLRNSSKSSCGRWNSGSAPLMTYRSPMVFTLRLRPLTSAMPTKSATSEPGMNCPARGTRRHANRTIRHTMPTMHACTLMVAPFAITAAILSAVWMGAASPGYVRPRKSFSCPMANVTAMPAVNPVVMVNGTKRMMAPSLNSPIRMSSAPAMMVAAISPSMPLVATMPATMVANAAVGPEICTRLPPKNAIRNPAMMAVYRPCSGVTPDAMPSATESGNATTATTMPATMSRGICCLSSSGVECLMMLKSMGFILSRCCMCLVCSFGSRRGGAIPVPHER